jgi:C4-dicarboxylate-binding protein DctP
VDAVLTSYETVASARLWEHGIKAVYEDRQYFAQYVPICSGLFWDRLPQEDRSIILETWDGIVDQARRDALVAQAVARAQMVSNNVAITLAGSRQMAETRKALMEHEMQIVLSLGIPGELYRLYQSFMAGVDGSSP